VAPPVHSELEINHVAETASVISLRDFGRTAVQLPLASAATSCIATLNEANLELSRFHLVRNSCNNLTDSRHLNEIFFDTL
jgi:hypothetical protein